MKTLRSVGFFSSLDYLYPLHYKKDLARNTKSKLHNLPQRFLHGLSNLPERFLLGLPKIFALRRKILTMDRRIFRTKNSHNKIKILTSPEKLSQRNKNSHNNRKTLTGK